MKQTRNRRTNTTTHNARHSRVRTHKLNYNEANVPTQRTRSQTVVKQTGKLRKSHKCHCSCDRYVHLWMLSTFPSLVPISEARVSRRRAWRRKLARTFAQQKRWQICFATFGAWRAPCPRRPGELIRPISSDQPAERTDLGELIGPVNYN